MSSDVNGRKVSQEFDGRKTSNELNGRKMSQEVSSGRKMSQEIGSGRKMSQDLNGMEGTEVMAVLNAPASETYFIAFICDLSSLENPSRERWFLLRNHYIINHVFAWCKPVFIVCINVFLLSPIYFSLSFSLSFFHIIFLIFSISFSLYLYPPESCFACRKPVLPEDGCSALGRSYHQVR